MAVVSILTARFTRAVGVPIGVTAPDCASESSISIIRFPCVSTLHATSIHFLFSRFASKLVYSGKWVADLPNGKGTCEYPTGHLYDGMWRNGLRHGEVWLDCVTSRSLFEGCEVFSCGFRVDMSPQKALFLTAYGEMEFVTVQVVKLTQMALL